MRSPDHQITFIMPDGERIIGASWSPMNLLTHADTYDIDLPQTCGGKAECGTCRVRVISGAVTPPRGGEEDLMRRHAKRFSDGERLSCQCRPRSDVVVEVLAVMPRDLRDR